MRASSESELCDTSRGSPRMAKIRTTKPTASHDRCDQGATVSTDLLQSSEGEYIVESLHSDCRYAWDSAGNIIKRSSLEPVCTRLHAISRADAFSTSHLPITVLT